MKKIRWGIIGCGEVTEKKSGPAFQKVQRSELTAVMRRDGAKAEDYARRHGVPCWYDDADSLIADEEVDAVYVATPPSSHAECAIRSARAGKPVYVEKPMALNPGEAESLLTVFRDKGVPLYVAYYRRALPRFLKVKELVDSGRIGSLRTVRTVLFTPAAKRPWAGTSVGTGKSDSEDGAKADEDRSPDKLPWRVRPEIAGGGYFFDLASHTLDFYDYLLGPITEVHGIAANLAGLYPAEDTLSAAWRFEKGVLGSGSWCFDADGELDENVITGTEGSVVFTTMGESPVELHTRERTELFDLPNPEHVQQPLISTVVEDLLKVREKGLNSTAGAGFCPSTGESALRTSRVMDEIVKSYYHSRT